MHTSNKITPHEISDMLFPINNRIKWVNNGGCGIVAAALYRELVKYGLKPTIVSLEDDELNTYHIKEYSKEFLPMLNMNRKTGTEPDRGAHAHYMIKLGNYIIDTRGSFKIQKDDKGLKFINYPPCHCDLYLLGTISVENLEYLNGIRWAWCSKFRRASAPNVQRLVKQQVAKIFN